jgi:hypothetical protein
MSIVVEWTALFTANFFWILRCMHDINDCVDVGSTPVLKSILVTMIDNTIFFTLLSMLVGEAGFETITLYVLSTLIAKASEVKMAS